MRQLALIDAASLDMHYLEKAARIIRDHPELSYQEVMKQLAIPDNVDLGVPAYDFIERMANGNTDIVEWCLL